jgi:hypothetical protein
VVRGPRARNECRGKKTRSDVFPSIFFTRRPILDIGHPSAAVEKCGVDLDRTEIARYWEEANGVRL